MWSHAVSSFLVCMMMVLSSCAWMMPLPKRPQQLCLDKVPSSLILGALPEGYQEFGEHAIRQAGEKVGVSNQDDLTIEWKTGRIIVTVEGSSVYVSNPDENEEDAEDDDDGKNCGKKATSSGVDVTQLAKAINSALDDDGVGLAIAETHEIEVTTPGASDELSGVMFESYRGFDVICQQQDPKTNKIKQIEGKLVERNDEFTVVNIKGRMKKMKNHTVLSVRLPKAKKEKGVK